MITIKDIAKIKIHNFLLLASNSRSSHKTGKTATFCLICFLKILHKTKLIHHQICFKIIIITAEVQKYLFKGLNGLCSGVVLDAFFVLCCYYVACYKLSVRRVVFCVITRQWRNIIQLRSSD